MIFLIDSDTRAVRISVNCSSQAGGKILLALLLLVIDGNLLVHNVAQELLVLDLFDDLRLVGGGTKERKHGWQEHQTVESTEDDDEEIHAEVVQFE